MFFRVRYDFAIVCGGWRCPVVIYTKWNIFLVSCVRFEWLAKNHFFSSSFPFSSMALLKLCSGADEDNQHYVRFPIAHRLILLVRNEWHTG